MTHFIGGVVVPADVLIDVTVTDTEWPDLYGKDAKDVDTIAGSPLDIFLSEALAPFDEELRVERWIPRDELIASERASIADYRDGLYAKYLADPESYAADCTNPKHLEYLRVEFPNRLEWTDDQCHAEAVRWYDEVRDDGAALDTYNPSSKWDWWTIGGRWERQFRGLQGEPLGDYRARLADAIEAGAASDEWSGRLIPAVLLTGGTWLEIGNHGWFGLRDDQMSHTEFWQSCLDATTDPAMAGARLLYIDFHI